jgi:hypothetical protein
MHVGCLVVPEREYENHPSAEGLAHTLQAALFGEVVMGHPETLCLRLAHLVRDGIERFPSKVSGLCILDDLAILHVEPADLDEVTGVRTITGQELCHNRDLFRGIHSETRAFTIELLSTQAEGIEIAPVFVAVPFITATTVTFFF